MATIETSPARPGRMSAKVDFTAMVDLGFLLITFFMLTTTLSKPTIMPIVMPETKGLITGEAVKSSQTLTLLLSSSDKIYYYEGIENARLDSTDYTSGGLRKILLDKKQRVQAQFGDEYRDSTQKSYSKLYVLIKAGNQSRYKNMVDALDEMKICGIAHYVLMDISAQETAFIHAPKNGLQFDEDAQMESIRQ